MLSVLPLLWAVVGVACAAPALQPVEISIDGMRLAKPGAQDGSEIYLPLEALKALALSYVLSRNEETASATTKGGRALEIPLAKLAGGRMAPFSSLRHDLQLIASVKDGIASITTPDGRKAASEQPPEPKPVPVQRLKPAAPVTAPPPAPKVEAGTPRPPAPAAPPPAVATQQPGSIDVRPVPPPSAQATPTKAPQPQSGGVQPTKSIDGAAPGPTAQAQTPVQPVPIPPVQFQDVQFVRVTDRVARVVIVTSGPVQPLLRVTDTARAATIELPNTTLAQPRALAAEHPLVGAVRVEASAKAPGAVTVALDLRAVSIVRIESANQRGLVCLVSAPKGLGKRMADATIVLDPGHGGGAPGCQSSADGGVIQEKALNLQIAVLVQDALAAMGARVVMTRSDDTDLPLNARPAVADSVGGDLFLSIHIDACPTPETASGSTTYYHTGSDMGQMLATLVIDRLASMSGIPNKGARADGRLYPTGLAVLRNANVPAALVEMGFLNHSRDRALLMDPAWQRRAAEAVAEGIRQFVESGAPRSVPGEPL
jgi:N-acetylmuramoyl-L-alanine amidase